MQVPFALRWIGAEKAFTFLKGEGKGGARAEDLCVFELGSRLRLVALFDGSGRLSAWTGDDPAMTVDVNRVTQLTHARYSEAHARPRSRDNRRRVTKELPAIDTHARAFQVVEQKKV